MKPKKHLTSVTGRAYPACGRDSQHLELTSDHALVTCKWCLKVIEAQRGAAIEHAETQTEREPGTL